MIFTKFFLCGFQSSFDVQIVAFLVYSRLLYLDRHFVGLNLASQHSCEFSGHFGLSKWKQIRGLESRSGGHQYGNR